MYSRAFYWLVQKCNETLDVKNVKRAYFIGVLDIAGFETFEVCFFFINFIFNYFLRMSGLGKWLRTTLH